jgi:hypothetical protein
MATAQTMASHSKTNVPKANKILFHADCANTEPAMEGTRGDVMTSNP